MGDTIEFPYNSRAYFIKATEYIENEKYEKALEMIEKVYMHESTLEISHLYINILYALKDYEKALEIANDFSESYLNNEEYTISYVKVLIKNRLFIEAEALIQNYSENVHSVYYSIWIHLKEELKLEREQYIKQVEFEKGETKRELLELEMHSPFKQSSIVKKAQQLDLKTLQEIGPIIFSNHYITGIIKRAYLEILVEKNDDKEYLFPWFNQERKIIPNQFSVFEQDPIYKDVQKNLNEVLLKNPDLYEPIQNEIVTDLLLLYPFTEEVVTDVEYWVKTYVADIAYSVELTVDVRPKNEEQRKLYHWRQKLRGNV